MLVDPLRRKAVAATPEEMVRQLAIAFLIREYQLGRGRIAVEKSLTSGVRERRFDLMVLDENAAPWMLVECKAPDVPLKDKVWDQSSLYNRSLQAPYIWVTNGHTNRVGEWDTEARAIRELDRFPAPR